MLATVATVATVAVVALVGCSSGSGGGSRSSTASTAATTTASPASESTGATTSSAVSSAWVETPVQFPVGGLTVYGTYRHRAGTTTRGPAALLIAGSGPTDRNGNSSIAGATSLNSLRLLATQLSTDGVATLRYDKLGSGQTGAGRFAADPGAVRVSTFSAEAAAALRFLAAQPATDPARLSVYGHSEGGLYALLLATGKAGTVPAIHSIGLLEPQSRRILDILDEQLPAQFAAAQRAGQLTGAQVRQYDAALTRTIAAVRAGRPVPRGLPAAVAALFTAATVPYLRDDDQYDPATLAAALPRRLRVLLTCSTVDTQVGCADTDHLVTGLRRAGVTLSYAHLDDMDHDLKHDTSRSATGDDADLPLSPQLVAALGRFTTT